MAFTAKDVAALREKTGCGMMDCKKALTEADGNMDAAIDFLREKGLAAAAKKSGRIAAEGVAYACTNEKGDVGVVVEVNAETDFVAKNDEFIQFVKTVAQTIIDCSPADVDALMECKASGTDKTVAELLQEKILTIGENIKIRRFDRKQGVVITYNHGEGRMSVLVDFAAPAEVASKPEFTAYAKDIAMQVAAIVPGYVCPDEVPADVVEHEKKILTEQIINDGKPANIAEKIVAGRLQKFFKEICLTEQQFVKDGDLSVQQYTEKVGKELGGDIKILSFTRFEKGEGLEKKEDNFADEVASMVK